MAEEGSGLPACVQSAWCDAGSAWVAVKFLEALLQRCCHSKESRGRGSAELQLHGAVGKRFNQGGSCTEHGWAGNEAEQRHFASRGCEFGNSQLLISLRLWPLEPGQKVFGLDCLKGRLRLSIRQFHLYG